MNVIQGPADVELAANMPDYIIDTDSTITFSVKYGSNTILSEEYVPDANFKVRIPKLGKLCAQALWGQWPSGSLFSQETLSGTFVFCVNGVNIKVCYVLFSRLQTLRSWPGFGWLSRLQEKVTRPSAPEWLTCLIQGAETIIARSGGKSVVLYTHSGALVPITVDVSCAAIEKALSISGLTQYEVVRGNDVMCFYVDYTQYLEQFYFRFKNVFDVPETVSCVGTLKLTGGDSSETGFMFGVERKFSIEPNDEYTVNSGVIFKQSDYKLWHDCLNAQEIEILVDGGWYPIVVTKQNYEREFRRSVLKAVEFSFKMANPDQNGLIDT